MYMQFLYSMVMTPAIPRSETPGSHDAPRHTFIDERLKDNAGKVIPTNVIVRTDTIHMMAQAAIQQHRSIMMIGAQTSATNCFEMAYRRPADQTFSSVVGIQAMTLAPDAEGNVPYEVTNGPYHHPEKPVRSYGIRINRDRQGKDLHTITLGAGVTFSQANHALRESFGDDEYHDYFLPIDLTTIDIAHAGAVYATGAQGPSRFRISDIATSITLTDGKDLIKLTDPKDIEKHQGLWGMTGGVVELELQVFQRPKHRFGFFIPLTRSSDGSWIEQSSAVLALLKEATTLKLADGKITSEWNYGLVDGVEVVARETLELVATTELPSGDNRTAAKNILRLMDERQKDGTMNHRSDFGIYITGNSRFAELDGFLEDDESPLAKLLAYAERGEHFLHANGIRTIIANEKELEEMRLLRESFADIARQHGKYRKEGQAKPFSESTDINCFIDPDVGKTMSVYELREKFRLLLRPYYVYETKVRELAEQGRPLGVDVTMTRYGHLNPRSLNLHTRVTLHAPDESLHGQVYQQVIQRAREHLLEMLKHVSDIHPDIHVEGGEKGKMTPEAYELMTEDRRAAVIETLAAANPQWQPHLKGVWAARADAARAACQAVKPVAVGV